MNPWADPDEVFVKVPCIVEVRFKSDNPEFYAPPVDLLEEQRRGLPGQENHDPVLLHLLVVRV